MDLGKEIRRLREEGGLTLEQLAKRADLTPNYIGTIENGKRDPSISTVLALARGLEVAPGDLLEGAEGLSPVATHAARLFDGAPADIKDAVLRILRAVTSGMHPGARVLEPDRRS